MKVDTKTKTKTKTNRRTYDDSTFGNITKQILIPNDPDVYVYDHFDDTLNFPTYYESHSTLNKYIVDPMKAGTVPSLTNIMEMVV